MKKELYCNQCGYEGKPRKKIRGNCYLEILLIIFAFAVPIYLYLTYLSENYSQSTFYFWGLILICFIPEIIYRTWRNSSGERVCPMCHSVNSMREKDTIFSVKKAVKKHTKKSTLICPHCSTENDVNLKFCLNCGGKINSNEIENEQIEDVLFQLENIEVDTDGDDDQEIELFDSDDKL